MMAPLCYLFGILVYICTINLLIISGFHPLTAFWMAVIGTIAEFIVGLHYQWFKLRRSNIN